MSIEMLYRAAGRPEVPGLVDVAGWEIMNSTKRRPKPAVSPAEGVCYLTGLPLAGVGLPCDKRLKDTWTAHDTVAAPQSDWLSPAAAFSLSEKASHPTAEKPFKMRSASHFVTGDAWRVFGLRNKVDMADILKKPPGENWFLAICESPLSSGHILYQTPVNRRGAAGWVVNLGGLLVSGSAVRFERLLTVIEELYRWHTKGTIGAMTYGPNNINKQGLIEWSDLESQVSSLRGSPLFKLALFLAQKEGEV